MTAKEPPTKTEPRAESLGEFTQFGRYFIFFLIVAEVILLPEVINMTFMIYGGVVPKVSNCGSHNLTHLPKEEICNRVANLKNETGCQPTLVADFQSVGYEFKKYCEESIEIKASISLFMFGCMVGSVFFGQLSDRFGRKNMLLVAHLGMFVFGFFAARARSLYEFSIIQLCSMFFTGGHAAIWHVYLLENAPKRHRLWVICLLTYSPNHVITAGLAWLSADWRTLLQVASALNVPAFCALIIAFESPRWMIQKGKLKEARITLSRIELINGTQTPERLRLLEDLIREERQLFENQKRKKQYYFYHLFHSVKSTIYTIAISYALVCTSILSFATVFNLEYLTGSLYLNISIYGIFRYFINITVGILDFYVPRLGRKLINNAFLSVILVLLATVVVTKLLGLDDAAIVRVCVLCSASLASQLYMLNAVITSELFPTAVRNVAASFIQLFSRFGGILAPHMFYLSVFWDPLPFIIMLLFITTNLVMFNAFIPETKNCALNDHFQEKRKLFQPDKPLLNNNGAEIPPKNNSAAGLVDDL